MQDKNSKNIIILITNAFPFMQVEQFLETEINYFNKNKLIIVPSLISEVQRDIDDKIKVEYFLAKNIQLSLTKKLLYIMNGICNKLFIKEHINENLLNKSKLKIYLSSYIRYKKYYELFDTYFSNLEFLSQTIVYTYWNTEITYALQMLKVKYNYILVSRIHGYDIYKERRPFEYMPLKKQFTNNIDKIFTITDNAKKYLNDTYGFSYNKLEVSRLGVENKNIITKPNKKNVLHIVSCSFLLNVKRVDKIIEALNIISKMNPNINYQWTHIGGGKLYNKLQQRANILFKDVMNVEFNFLGNLDNIDVYQFYKENSVDVFVNTSVSEGVPVSIMEAMSCHIPIIAPDVGGISDMLIDKVNGCLLSADCLIIEIVNALDMCEYFKDRKTREASYQIYNEKYNAKYNYSAFIKKLITLRGTSLAKI